MKKVQFIVAIVLMVAAVFAAMGFFSFRRADNQKDILFNTERAVEDIRMVSESPHSILHPLERAGVRNYLYGRLEDMGGSPAVLQYDSVPCKFGGTIDIANVYCKFEPDGQDTSGAYLMMVAHLDSRFPEKTPDGRTVCSYGAADDGYGLAVALELARGAMTYSHEWNQGLKILFTDSEEHELDGMRKALEEDFHLFDNVGLLINIDARGVRGPALLFETSEGNSGLMDFYCRNAAMPYTYSLTSWIYSRMPNSTDFTPAKPHFPGYNFSVIDNIHYYHNDRDNFRNVHPDAVAHYGVQLEPMLREYLSGKEYADVRYFCSDQDNTVFTVPGLCTFNLGKTADYVLNAVIMLVFLFVMKCYMDIGRIKVKKVLLNAVSILGTGLLAGAAATGAVWLAARIAGVPFSLTSMKFLSCDWIIALAAIFIMLASYAVFFVRKAGKSEGFVFEHVLGAVLLALILSAVLLFTVGEDFFLMFPVACVLAGLFFHLIIYLNLISLPVLLLILMTGVSFLYNLYAAITAGALGVVVFLAYLYTVMIASMLRCYMNQRR